MFSSMTLAVMDNELIQIFIFVSLKVFASHSIPQNPDIRVLSPDFYFIFIFEIISMSPVSTKL